MMRRRLEFSAETKRQAFERSGDICECYLIPWLKRPNGCGAKLGIGNVFYDGICRMPRARSRTWFDLAITLRGEPHWRDTGKPVWRRP
jgi:hypothetical protein